MDLYGGGVYLRRVNVSDKYLIRFWHSLIQNVWKNKSKRQYEPDYSKSVSFVQIAELWQFFFFFVLSFSDTFFVE